MPKEWIEQAKAVRKESPDLPEGAEWAIATESYKKKHGHPPRRHKKSGLLEGLIRLADHLESVGLPTEARVVDRLFIRIAQYFPTTSAKVIIDPLLRGRIEKAIEHLHRAEPDLLKDVTHIYALHTNNFGEWHSDDPTAVYLNLDLIEQRIKQLTQQGMNTKEAELESIEEEIRDAIQKQVALTLGHEATHSKDLGRGGEGTAKETERRLQPKLERPR